MTANLEKIFFKYILENKHLFNLIPSFYFRNEHIRLVYKVIRDYILSDENIQIPSNKQILEMVNIVDKNSVITKEILKAILSTTLEDYNEDSFIRPKFKEWTLRNKIEEATSEIVDITRDMDDYSGDYEHILDVSNKIKDIAYDVEKQALDLNDNNDDFGSDFDDLDSHIQDNSVLKVNSGFNTFNQILGGGFDIDTLNILMAETNNGKSLWMQNFAVKISNTGKNVLYITLEMSEKKVMKRLGAMRLKIPINDYDRVSLDREEMKRRINNLKKTNETEGTIDSYFESQPGKIIVKFWPAGTATIETFDLFIQKYQNKTGIKIDFIIVDYITLIAPSRGVKSDNLYLKGKNLSEGLRALASKYHSPVLTAIQIAKNAWNSTDITLESIPESKAIAETADSFFAIIRNEEMKSQGLYHVKLLKQRDGDFSRQWIKARLNSNYLTVEDDDFIGN